MKWVILWIFGLSLWCSRVGLGGYSIPRLGIEAVPLGAEMADKDGLDLARARGLPYPPIAVPLTTEQWTQLKVLPFFRDLTNDVVLMEKLVGVRVMVLCAMDALRGEDPAAAEFLARLYRKGLIGLARAPGCLELASLANDSSSDYGAEPLNLYHYPCGEVPLYDPAFFRLANALAHEALHATRSRFRVTDPDNPDQRVRYLMDRQSRELEASAEELNRIDDLQQALQSILDFGRLPDALGALAGRIGGALLNDLTLTVAQRGVAARTLLNSLQESRMNALGALEYRQAYKRALELFQQGGVTRMGPYNAAIQESGWYHESIHRELPGSGSLRMTYRAGGGRFVPGPNGPATEFQPLPNLIQYNDEGLVHQFLLPGRSISDCFQLRDKRHLLVAGTDAMGVGVVWGLEDTNTDGYYERESIKELFRDGQLGGGLRWVWDRSEQALLGVNRRTANVFSFSLPMTGGFPDQWVPLGSVDPRGDLLHFWAYGGTLYGAADLGAPLSVFDVYATAERTQVGGPFVPTLPYVPRGDAWHRPALAQLPFPGATFLDVRAVPGSTVEVVGRKQDGTSYSLGSGKADWTGGLSAQLKSSLEGGGYVHVVDAQAKLNSVEEPVKAPAADLRMKIALLPGGLGNLGLSYSYKPHIKLQLQYAEHLDEWEPLGQLDLGGYGMRTLLTEPPAVFAGFFRATEILPPALLAAPDRYASGPGLTLRANVLGNDVAPAGTRVVLDSDPGVHPGLFSWSGDGSFSLTAPITGPTSLQFKYHLQRDDGTRSDTVTVDITLAFTALIQLAQYAGANGNGMYYVPCLYLSSPSPLGGRPLWRAFPIYQFRLANNPADACKEAHWHARGPVYPLSSIYEALSGFPTGSLTDPDRDECGFGKFGEVPFGLVSVPVGYWNVFLNLHPTPQ